MNTQTLKVRTESALDVFDGSVARLALFLEIKPAAIYQWGEFVPTVRAYQLRDSFPNIKTVPTSEDVAA